METRMIAVQCKDAPPSDMPRLDAYRQVPNGMLHSKLAMKTGEFMKMMKKINGFTLMEIMMVVAIISIAAAISGFSFSRLLPDMRVKAAAEGIKSDLNLARLKAVRENLPVTVDFSMDSGHEYEIYLTNSDDSKTSLKKVKFSDGIAIDDVALSLGSEKITFHGQGLPTNNGQVSLRNEKGTLIGVIISTLGKITILKG